MSVESFDPDAVASGAVAIEVTSPASDHIETQIAQSGESHIRLAIEESGCNGYRYALHFISEPAPDDRPLAGRDGWQLFVREKDLPFVNGTRIELEVKGLNRALRFANPNADSHCGCGESFSVA
ncbi:MAG: iron-sulfur cluster assembly accessory protein [Pseudomonadota bacterium]